MSPPDPDALETAIPDLRSIPLDRLAGLGSSALAHSVALYRERLKEQGIPLSSFNARILGPAPERDPQLAH